MTAEAIDHPQAFVGRGSALYLRFDTHALAPDKEATRGLTVLSSTPHRGDLRSTQVIDFQDLVGRVGIEPTTKGL